jgi:cyanophycin synthetase
MYIKEDASASYKLLAQELEKRGYKTDTAEDPVVVTYTSPSGNIWRTSASHIAYPFTDKKTREISICKNLAYDLAKEVGFPIPQTLHITEQVPESALQAMLDTVGQLIVKPTSSSLSHGLSVNIRTLPALRQAIEEAKLFSDTVLAQEQVTGEEIRFTVIDGQVQAALLRRTARVVGDGMSTVSELIRIENKEREALTFEYLSYPQLDGSLIDESLLSSTLVLKDGEILELSRSTMIRGGCSVYNILPDVDETYIKAVQDLSRHLNTKFVVVDVFCKSYADPAIEGNHWFIEFNTAPVLKLFYSCRDGRHFDIVPYLANAIDYEINK